MNDHSDCISGFFLEAHRWKKSKTKNGTYEREGHEVFYDGTNWHYDGKQIEDSVKKNPKLKVPSFRFTPPFKDDVDYYERMMENK